MINFMGKKAIWVAIVFCICAYAGILGFSYYRYHTKLQSVKETAQREFDSLVDKASAAAVLGFMEEPFLEAVRDSVDKSLSIAAVIITGPDGPEYAYEKVTGFLNKNADSPEFIYKRGISPEPYNSVLHFHDIRNTTIRALAYDISYNDIFIIIRDTALLLLIPIATAALSLLLAPSDNAKLPRESSSPTQVVSNSSHTLEALNDYVPGLVLDDLDDKPIIDSQTYGSAQEEISVAPTMTTIPNDEPRPNSGLSISILLDRLSEALHNAAITEQDIVFLVMDQNKSQKAWLEKLDLVLKEVSSFFPSQSLVYHIADKGIAIIIPNCDIDNGFTMAEDFINSLRGASSELSDLILQTDPRIGLTARAGRLVEADRLVHEAFQALSRAKKEALSPLVAFKPDASRYRAYVAQSNGIS